MILLKNYKNNCLKNYKQYAFVIRQIGYKNEIKKNSETSLGQLWNIINPLLYMIILSLYYQNIVVHDIEMYPVFVFVGIIIMRFFEAGTMGAMKCLVKNKSLLIRSRIPIDVFFWESIYSALKDMAYSSVALVLVMFFFKVHITLRIFLVVPILLLTSLIVIGVGKILAVVYVFFGDVDYLYGLFMTMMFFVSGIFIPIDELPEQLSYWLSFNPIFLSIYLIRNNLMYNLESHWTAWIKLILWTVIIYPLGNYIYKRNKNRCINEL